MYRSLGALVLGLGLLTPVGILNAQDHPDHVEKAHQWSDNENGPWHQYLKEHHKKGHEWAKSNKHEQADYWKWRDQHRDAH